jgi:hypothetical protein
MKKPSAYGFYPPQATQIRIGPASQVKVRANAHPGNYYPYNFQATKFHPDSI